MNSSVSASALDRAPAGIFSISGLYCIAPVWAKRLCAVPTERIITAWASSVAASIAPLERPMTTGPYPLPALSRSMRLLIKTILSFISCFERVLRSSSESTMTTSAVMPFSGVATEPPSAVTTSFCSKGARIFATASPRDQFRTLTGCL